ncbi:MAG: IclR family transcriptional regulator [Thermanaeromonas sp.]|uniref:IclR family transcriptional regulator n=1 Tax=Thermanaeromonas sp. TaxID=2003697 RepID=UPI00243D3FBE|nr:IclR family transcriptional regulator [Thermanaeromonas sp.]MCG0277302.1 IclR family transcriptional regulator [Thermanaeromonas sp.]
MVQGKKKTPEDSSTTKKIKGVQAVERALIILEALAKAEGPVSLSSLSAEVGLHVSTVHRLLSTLARRGFVEQEPNQGRYRLGLKIFEIGHRALYSLDIRAVARPFLRQLVEEFNETANLAVLDGTEVVYIDQVESKNMIKMMARPGTRVPAYCTGAGKVLLAGLPAFQLERVLSTLNLRPYTAASITSVEQLKKELEQVRRQGYAIDRGELEEGVRCVAAPIINHEQRVVAALSVSGPSNRITEELLQGRLVEAVCRAARAVSEALGSYANKPRM